MIDCKLKKLIIIVGHYGSGKTEFALNYALRLKQKADKVNLVDLDVVNPYFRSRDFAQEFLKKGINVVSAEKGFENADMPALSPRIFGCLQDDDPTLFDVGGDDAGALALGYYHNYFMKMPYEMWCVVNANRPFTSDAHKAYEYIKDIERSSRLNITHVINNTHMLGLTTPADIQKGEDVADELVKIAERDFKHIEVKYTAGLKNILSQTDVRHEKFYIDKLVKQDFDI